ncbi:MAG: LVIVD repeat-containing protein [Kofleriaceae bacterium]
MIRSSVVLGLAICAAIACGGRDANDSGDDDTSLGDGGLDDSDGGAEGPPTLTLVGHNDLGARGMNAALALYDHYAYISFRGDATRDDAGIAIVDIADPTQPQLVGHLGAPDEAVDGLTSRELRVIPAKKLLIVMNATCNAGAQCASNPDDDPGFKFFDLTDPVHPARIGSFDISHLHEFFVWQDPANPQRILLYVTSNETSTGLAVLDATDPTDVQQLGTWKLGRGVQLHSLSVSDDGTTAYMAHAEAGVMVADVSDFATGANDPELRLVTGSLDGAKWTGETHSAVLIPGRPVVLATDENWDCPYGFVHMADITNPAKPVLVGEYRLPENDPSSCTDDPVPFTSHNPTVTEHLAIITWYAHGMLVLDTTDPAHPTELVRFTPAPIPSVATEEPELEGNHVLMWSYPILKDGLIYVADIRNGLYVLRYTGPHQGEVTSRAFLEGNSNLK